MSDDQLRRLLQEEADRLPAASLKGSSRRRIRIRQSFIVGGLAAVVVTFTMTATNFIVDERTRNDFVGQEEQGEGASDEEVAIEVVFSVGSGEVWGKSFQLEAHSGEGIEGTCYVLRVEGFEPSQCVSLGSHTYKEIALGGADIPGWDRSFLLVEAPSEIFVGLGMDHAADVWMPEPPFSERGLTLAVFNRPTFHGTVVSLRPSDESWFELELLETVTFEDGDLRFRAGGPTDANLGRIARCPRLFLPGDQQGAAAAVEAWAREAQPDEATGFTEIGISQDLQSVSGCPDWVAARSLSASFSWEGGPYDDSASLSQVRVLVGRTLDGSWQVWYQEH